MIKGLKNLSQDQVITYIDENMFADVKKSLTKFLFSV